MVKKKTYLLLFFVVVMASHVVAMDHGTPFFIENPFDKKQKDNTQFSLKTPTVSKGSFFQEDDFMQVSGGVESFFYPEYQSTLCLDTSKKNGDNQINFDTKKTCFDKECCIISSDNDENEVLLLQQPCGLKRRYEDVLEKNENDAFVCPYNCPEQYAHKEGRMVGYHIKARHDKKFDLQTFDHKIIDVNKYISRKRKRYADVLKKKKGKLVCPYNCPENYSNKTGRLVVQHVHSRHDPHFSLQTFAPENVDLNVYIPCKSRWDSMKRHKDVFEKNKNGAFECPYNCPDEYENKNSENVIDHIQARHDKTFRLQTFDPVTADLNAYIPRKKAGRRNRSSGKKNKRKMYVNVFEKNEDGQYGCPYNCPDNYAHARGDLVIKHIKSRHDKDFDLQIFDKEKADLNVYISRKIKWGGKTYNDVFDKNKDNEYECPYHCPEHYTHKRGDCVVGHIKARHTKDFDLQTFDCIKADLDVYIPWKSRWKRHRDYVDVFEKNEDDKYTCPYNCRHNYTSKYGKDVVRHIKTKHNENFKLQTFNSQVADLNAWIPRKKDGARKRKRKHSIAKDGDIEDKKRKKKKRKLTI